MKRRLRLREVFPALALRAVSDFAPAV